MKNSTKLFVGLLLFIAIGWSLDKSNELIPQTKITAVTYVYEKDKTEIPSLVAVGINKLNIEKGVIATSIEIDAFDGTGEIPKQYQTPIAAAKAAGVPDTISALLVATSGDKVLQTVKEPTTDTQVLEVVP